MLIALRRVYLFAFAIGAMIHIATISISLASALSPAIFAPGYSALLRPSRVFAPVSLFSRVQVSSIGEGGLGFLQWDELVGSMALLLWAAALHRNSLQVDFNWQRWVNLFGKALGLTLVAGPCSAAVALVWERDELIFSQGATRDKKAR